MFNERDRRCAAVQPCSLPIKLMTTGPLPAPSKCKSRRFNVPRVMKTKFPATVMVFWCGFMWGPHHATSHLRSRLESQHQSVPGCVEECGDPLVQSGGRWQTLGVAAGLAPAHKSKETEAWLQKECYDFVHFSHWPLSSLDLNPLDYFVWSYVKDITNMTSHKTKASLIAAICRVFAELPQALVEKACSQFWIRIEAAIEAEGGCIE